MDEVTVPDGGSITLSYETAPRPDPVLFLACATITAGVTSAPLVTKIRSADSVVPIARWLRWKLEATADGPWSVTFRVVAAGGAATARGFVDPWEIFGSDLVHFWGGRYSQPSPTTALWVDEGTEPADAIKFDTFPIPSVGNVHGYACPIFEISDFPLLSPGVLADLDGVSSFTIFGAFRIDRGYDGGIVERDGQFSIEIRWLAHDGIVNLEWKGEGPIYETVTGVNRVADGMWHRFVWRVDALVSSFFIDGVLQTDMNYTYAAPLQPGVSDPWVMGRDWHGDRLVGAETALGVAMRAATDEEVASLDAFLRAWVGTPASPPPVLTSLSPALADPLGGGTLTVRGSGLSNAAFIFFGDDEGPYDFVIVSDTEIHVTIPSHAPGTVLVRVTNVGGYSNALPLEYS
jgi:hypothetical protein